MLPVPLPFADFPFGWPVTCESFHSEISDTSYTQWQSFGRPVKLDSSWRLACVVCCSHNNSLRRCMIGKRTRILTFRHQIEKYQSRQKAVDRHVSIMTPRRAHCVFIHQCCCRVCLMLLSALLLSTTLSLLYYTSNNIMAAGGPNNQRIIPLEEGWNDEIKVKVCLCRTISTAVCVEIS